MTADLATISEAFCTIQNSHILVVGDVMLDRFIDGHVSRISPEAPVPILEKSAVKQMPGGSANVACNLAFLGAKTTLIGAIGDDDAGQILAAELGKNPAITFAPHIVAGRPTTLKTRYRAAGQQILRVDDEDTSPLMPDVTDAILSQIETCLKSTPAVDAVIISDYAKGCLTPAVIQKIVTLCKQADIKTIADPKLADFSAYRGVDILTPNLSELRAASYEALDAIDDITNVAHDLIVKHELGGILATLSARGMVLTVAGGTTILGAATARDVFDVSGAGDTVVATVAACVAQNIAHPLAVDIANLAAGVAVAKSGTAIVSPGEILAQLPTTKIATDWPYWADQCQQWRKSGAKVGFTNGCFDLLHPGHIYLLQQAAAHCDRLIVGLNSDLSVKRLKGNNRPLQSSDSRANVLASLPFIDGVAVFEEDTPYNLVSTLQPDVIIKGGDYKASDVVGADIVNARGGEVIITPTLGTHSSSAIIER
ncbi:PfkB family carbohydrate kinase [Candidatus Puniceispirillum marinum]|uniref:Bifunctional protein HldE n=1 Tax=Puniceispirillum marinum (strain IMCC1322) TaxID=488538 RepID=D5BRQ0_PUNMI|nr:bifunctional heptose 7-phosphate kinase/heptose 1-phosphate adenyltransferase [Candidatus Puniceispirillum marinum]ADE38947.1 rfaE bifunctional protein [Candidatus Puniceispirillum marinum IMCC1322]